MNTSMLAQELDAMRHDFAQYRVEMALRVDSLERRLSAAENAFPRRSNPVVSLPLASLRRTPAQFTTSSSGYGSSMHGFAERGFASRAPAPTITAPSSSAYTLSPYRFPQQSSRSAAPSSSREGSDKNAAYLPFVLEKIALEAQKKSPGDNRTCTCGRPTFDIQCFRLHHFGWCLAHQRPIVPAQHSCGGRDHRNCQPIHWEKHADWEVLVKTSFDSGSLGRKNVNNLHKALFPQDLYPEKYQGSQYVG